MNFKPQCKVRNPELRVVEEYKLPLDSIPAVDPVSNDKVLSDTNTSTKVEKKPEVVSKTQSEIPCLCDFIFTRDIVPQKDNVLCFIW